MELHRIFLPLSSQGFHFDEEYAELPPCAALAPVIRCFWGTARPRPKPAAGSRIIPDVCMDLIFEINHSRGSVSCHFCSLDDIPVQISPRNPGEICESFGIRFFAWSAVCFAEDSLRHSREVDGHPDRYFARLRRELEPMLLSEATLCGRARAAERILWKRFHPERMQADLLNALHAMIVCQGATRVRDFAQAACVGERQLERLFLSVTGAPPKLLSQLIRHQRIYRELLEGRFHPLDAVSRYGYADQSHLLRDFRRFHGQLPSTIASQCRIFSSASGDHMLI